MAAPGQSQDGDSSCGHQIQLLPELQLWKHDPSAVTTLAPFSSVWGPRYQRERVCTSGCAEYFQIRWRAKEETQNLDSSDVALQRQWVSGELMTGHRLAGA